MTKRKYVNMCVYMLPDMKYPSVQLVRWKLLKPTVHVHIILLT